MSTDVATVTRDLGEIIRLAADLAAQARATPAHGTDLVGGEAMANLAPVANLEAWQHKLDAAEGAYYDGERAWPVHYEDDADEPALQTLLFWSEALRTQYDADLDGRTPTLDSEARFLRWHADAIWRSEPHWDDMADDVRDAKRRLEDVLRAGERVVTGVPCLYDECQRKRIIRKMQPGRDEAGVKVWRQSDWFCPSCHRTWTEDEYARMVAAAAHAERFVTIAGETWCGVETAARETGARPNTIRVWVSRQRIGVACVVPGRRRGFVCLREVRERHAAQKDEAA